jgi:hypothetical protein
MYDLTGKITNVSLSFLEKKLHITVEVNEQDIATQMLDELQGLDKLAFKFGKVRKKRSLDANAYAWVLIGKIAEKTKVSKDEIYQEAIRNVGGNYEIVCCKDDAVETLRTIWQNRGSEHGSGWVTETMPSKIAGCTNVFLYYGSSVFDVDQMNRLITNLQHDCAQLGIEVKPQAEINSLLNSWR